jgi:hypothetical protein
LCVSSFNDIFAKNKDMKFYSKDIYSANVPNLVEKLEKSEGFDFMGMLYRNWIVVHRYGDYVCVKDGRFKSELHIRIFENKKKGTYEIECMVHKIHVFFFFVPFVFGYPFFFYG